MLPPQDQYPAPAATETDSVGMQWILHKSHKSLTSQGQQPFKTGITLHQRDRESRAIEIFNDVVPATRQSLRNRGRNMKDAASLLREGDVRNQRRFTNRQSGRDQERRDREDEVSSAHEYRPNYRLRERRRNMRPTF
ncbi:hypothetical protein XENTR_v10013923 [Xenopus tropicalis]|nr:hypothetical protein XENTR_v10013923 [Xenopus tropicalis]